MSEEKEPSGKFLLRLPKFVHAQAIQCAEKEGVSLNQLILTLVAEGLGRRDAFEEMAKRLAGDQTGRTGSPSSPVSLIAE